MTALVVLGVIFVTCVAIYLTFAAGASAFGSIAFTGRIDPITYVFAFLAVMFWYLVVWLFPFEFSMKMVTA